MKRLLNLVIVLLVTSSVLSACGGISQVSRVIVASGEIHRDDTVTLEPWYHSTASMGPMSPLPATSGAYTVEAVDALSQTLASQGFDVSFAPLLDVEPQEVDVARFDVAVAFPPGTAAFRIKHGDKVLRVVPVSSNAPTITLTAAPAPGQVVSGVYTITWQSADADGDLLYHIVEYSHNGRDWFVLASNITVTQTVEDFDALPGGQQARFRVFGSDGVNAAEATSAAFVVPPKPPEVFIESLKPGARYMAGTNVPLSGWANDEQDGNLYSSDALVWYSDQDGTLARGPDLNTHTLSAGQHTITLSATNSAGLTGSASVTITIEAP
jgi:hypothetical protein